MTQKYLVHYTSFKFLNNILGETAIRLHDCKGMNDGRELEHFKDKITKDLMEGFKDDLKKKCENYDKLEKGDIKSDYLQFLFNYIEIQKRQIEELYDYLKELQELNKIDFTRISI
jgi:hypothetical protein